ncbi:hypothetical protein INT45_002697 [Circinella minor]|uniref:Uncharacterized protein n=1 Tax=Circinella minor TaxID=1195481 RepID=A0A8H7S4J0_9FUNG|nr:hypothetical protein INT45_002697 [Circinella minor]
MVNQGSKGIVQWVYSSGSNWTPLDHSPSFGGQAVFVDAADLTITHSGYAYTIARRYEKQRIYHRRQ